MYELRPQLSSVLYFVLELDCACTWVDIYVVICFCNLPVQYILCSLKYEIFRTQDFANFILSHIILHSSKHIFITFLLNYKSMILPSYTEIAVKFQLVLYHNLCVSVN